MKKITETTTNIHLQNSFIAQLWNNLPNWMKLVMNMTKLKRIVESYLKIKKSESLRFWLFQPFNTEKVIENN